MDPAFKADFCRAHVSSKEGARPLERAIEDEIVAPLVEKLLDGEIKPGQRVVVQSGGQLAVAGGPAPQAEGPAEGHPAPKGDRPAPMADAGPVAAPPRPAAPSASPRPAAGGPGDRDQQQARNEAAFDRELAAIAGKLRQRGIEIEITPEARAFLCDPFWAELPLPEALIRLVAEPLLQKIEAGELRSGDRVQRGEVRRPPGIQHFIWVYSKLVMRHGILPVSGDEPSSTGGGPCLTTQMPLYTSFMSSSNRC